MIATLVTRMLDWKWSNLCFHVTYHSVALTHSALSAVQSPGCQVCLTVCSVCISLIYVGCLRYHDSSLNWCSPPLIMEKRAEGRGTPSFKRHSMWPRYGEWVPMLWIEACWILETSWFFANEIRVVKHATFLSSLRGPGGVWKGKKSHQVRNGYLSKATALMAFSLSAHPLYENTTQEQHGGMINEGSLRNLIFFFEPREKGHLEKLKSSWKFFQCWRIQRGFSSFNTFLSLCFHQHTHFHPHLLISFCDISSTFDSSLLLSLVFLLSSSYKNKEKK